MKLEKQVEKLFEEIIRRLYKEAHSLQTVVKWLMSDDNVFLSEGFKLSRAYEAVREAKIYFGKYMKDADSDLLNECIHILQNNREKASKQNNLKEVRECTKEIAKLQQLYVDTQKLDITTKGDKIENINITIIRPDEPRD
jgi:mRNA-degrading endonuclease YafQ of YafQ-DinJ toxin-antitoxin module